MGSHWRWMVALVAIGAAACSKQVAEQGASAPAPASHSEAVVPDAALAEAPGPAARSGHGAGTRAGMKVYIDPATGQPRDPTPAEIAAAGRGSRVNAQSSAATGDTSATETGSVRRLPSGQLEVQVGSRALHDERVCRQPDGSLGEQNCPPAPAAPQEPRP